MFFFCYALTCAYNLEYWQHAVLSLYLSLPSSSFLASSMASFCCNSFCCSSFLLCIQKTYTYIHTYMYIYIYIYIYKMIIIDAMLIIVLTGVFVLSLLSVSWHLFVSLFPHSVLHIHLLIIDQVLLLHPF